MKAVCVDANNTWRDVLTVGKSYEVLKKYIDSYDTEIVEIKCDDEKIRPYRAERFSIKKGV